MTPDHQLPNHETFRCVACPGPAHLLPSFLNFKDVRLHSFKDHMVTVERGVQASTLLPTTLTVFMCKLCPEATDNLFLTEEQIKAHLVKHSNFFAARWKLFSELQCRVCEIVIDQDSDEDHMSSAHSKALFADIDDAIGDPDTNRDESKTIVEDLVYKLLGLVWKEEDQIQNKESAEVKVKTEVIDATEVDALVENSKDKQCFKSSNSAIVGDDQKKSHDLVNASSLLSSLEGVNAEDSKSSSSQKLMVTSQGGVRLKPIAVLLDQNKLNIGKKRKTKRKNMKKNAEIIQQVTDSVVSPLRPDGSSENSQCLDCQKVRADCGQCRVCLDRSLTGNLSEICVRRRVGEKCEKVTGGTYRTLSWISEYCCKHDDVIKVHKKLEPNLMSLVGIKKWVSAENIRNYFSENGVEVKEVLICGGAGKVVFSNEKDTLNWNSRDLFIMVNCGDETTRINKKCHIISDRNEKLKPENKLAILKSRRVHKMFFRRQANRFTNGECRIEGTQLHPNEEARVLLSNKEDKVWQDKNPDLVVKEDLLEIFSRKERPKNENKDDHSSENKEDGSRPEEAYGRDSSRSQTINIRSKSEVGNRMEGISTREGWRGRSKSRCNVRKRSRSRDRSMNRSRDRSMNRSRDRSMNRSRDGSKNRCSERSRNRSIDRRMFRDLSNHRDRKWSRDRSRTRYRRSRSRRSRDRRRSRERRSRHRSRSTDRQRSRDRISKERRRSRDRRSRERRRLRDTNRSRSRIMDGNGNKRKRSTSKERFEAGLGQFLKNIRSRPGQVGN